PSESRQALYFDVLVRPLPGSLKNSPLVLGGSRLSSNERTSSLSGPASAISVASVHIRASALCLYGQLRCGEHIRTSANTKGFLPLCVSCMLHDAHSLHHAAD